MIMLLPAVLLLGILEVLQSLSNEAEASPDERIMVIKVHHCCIGADAS